MFILTATYDHSSQTGLFDITAIAERRAAKDLLAILRLSDIFSKIEIRDTCGILIEGWSKEKDFYNR